MNVRTNIYECPHILSSKHICQSGFPQKTQLQHGKKDEELQFQAHCQVSLSLGKDFSFFRAKYIMIMP